MLRCAACSKQLVSWSKARPGQARLRTESGLQAAHTAAERVACCGQREHEREHPAAAGARWHGALFLLGSSHGQLLACKALCQSSRGWSPCKPAKRMQQLPVVNDLLCCLQGSMMQAHISNFPCCASNPLLHSHSTLLQGHDSPPQQSFPSRDSSAFLESPFAPASTQGAALQQQHQQQLQKMSQPRASHGSERGGGSERMSHRTNSATSSVMERIIGELSALPAEAEQHQQQQQDCCKRYCTSEPTGLLSSACTRHCT